MNFESVYAIAVVVIPLITQYVKQFLPERLWALIPFALGAIVAGIWGTQEGQQIQDLVWQALAVGGVSTGLYTVTRKAVQPASNGKKKK